MLPAGPAETLQREPRRIVPLLHAHLLDRVGHVRHRHPQETPPRPRADRPCPSPPPATQISRAPYPHPAARRRPARRSPGSAPPAPCRRTHSRPSPSAARPADSSPAPDWPPRYPARPAPAHRRNAGCCHPGRHRVDRHHRRPHPHAGHLRLERPLERAVIQGDIGAGAAHVEPDDPRPAPPSPPCAPPPRCRPPDPTGSRPCRWNRSACASPPLDCMKYSLRTPSKLASHLRDIAPQDRRQVGVHHRRVAARHQPQQRAHRMARRHLPEPGLGAPARPAGRSIPGCFQAWISAIAHAPIPVIARAARERRARPRLVQRLDLVARDPPRHARRPPPPARTAGSATPHPGRTAAAAPGCRSAAGPPKPAIDHQQRPLALALQQRVGRDRRAHLHLVHQPCGGIGASSRDRPAPA